MAISERTKELLRLLRDDLRQYEGLHMLTMRLNDDDETAVWLYNDLNSLALAAGEEHIECHTSAGRLFANVTVEGYRLTTNVPLEKRTA